ncbi:MAG: hypothetical protein CMJ46_09245 [Planctomyces sp.]|nr:hypothetical protein [Planctomyces sp.]
MATNAKVHSFEAIKHLHAALIIYAEEATGVLATLHQEIIRVSQWLQHDQPSYWKKQVQKGFEEVAAAKAALARARMKGFDGNPPSCIEEKKALQKAKRALDHAQKQIEVVRHWGIKMQQESDEYRGRLGRLDTVVNHEIPHMLVLLENMVTALEQYVAVQTVDTQKNMADMEQSRQQRTAGNKPGQQCQSFAQQPGGPPAGGQQPPVQPAAGQHPATGQPAPEQPAHGQQRPLSHEEQAALQANRTVEEHQR